MTPLTSYGDLADTLDQIGVLASSARRMRRLTLRSAAIEIGVAPATLLRIEGGEDCALSSAIAVLRWLDRCPEPGPEPGLETAVPPAPSVRGHPGGYAANGTRTRVSPQSHAAQ